MPLSAGTRLGPYEILAPIGAGGMGESAAVGVRPTRDQALLGFEIDRYFSSIPPAACQATFITHGSPKRTEFACQESDGPGDLRHSAATILKMAGVPDQAIPTPAWPCFRADDTRFIPT
jgi:hypothetical protein